MAQEIKMSAAGLKAMHYSLNDKIVVFDRIRENAVNLPRNTSMYSLFTLLVIILNLVVSFMILHKISHKK